MLFRNWLVFLVFLPIVAITVITPDTRADLSLPVWRLVHHYINWVDMELVTSVGHYCTFFLTGLICLRLFWQSRFAWLAVLVGAGATSEYVQSFVPGRHSSIEDFFVNVAGVTTALLLCYGFQMAQKLRTPAIV